MTVTCRVVESDSGRAVPDTVGLEPESIDLLPFEVQAGERFADVTGPGHRFFQYHYVLRLTGEDYFGRDVLIPPLELNYRIERPGEAGTVLPGRELTYVLPGEPIRVLSLVPETAADIRGIPLETLGAAEARLARADVLLLAAAGLGLVAAGAAGGRPAPGPPGAAGGELAGGAAGGRGGRSRRRRARADGDPAGERGSGLVARADRTRTGGVAARRGRGARSPGRRARRRGGRQPAAGRAPRPLRSAGAAVGHGVVARHAAHGGRRCGRSGGATISGGDLERLQRALAVFSAARYARPGEPLPGALTLALEDGIEVSRQLRVRALAPLQWARRLGAALRGWWPRR